MTQSWTKQLDSSGVQCCTLFLSFHGMFMLWVIKNGCSDLCASSLVLEVLLFVLIIWPCWWWSGRQVPPSSCVRLIADWLTTLSGSHDWCAPDIWTLAYKSEQKEADGNEAQGLWGTDKVKGDSQHSTILGRGSRELSASSCVTGKIKITHDDSYTLKHNFFTNSSPETRLRAGMCVYRGHWQTSLPLLWRRHKEISQQRSIFRTTSVPGMSRRGYRYWTELPAVLTRPQETQQLQTLKETCCLALWAESASWLHSKSHITKSATIRPWLDSLQGLAKDLRQDHMLIERSHFHSFQNSNFYFCVQVDSEMKKVLL